MTFQQATDELILAGFRAEEIGEALGLEAQTIRQMRTKVDSPSYRRPPDPETWRPKLAKLARERGAQLAKLAKRIEG